MTSVVSVKEISSKLTQYAELPEREKPAFGKIILASLMGAEAGWTEAERIAFWAKHSVQIDAVKARLIEADDEKSVAGINWKSGVAWPAYYFLQVHPEVDALGMVNRYWEGLQSPIKDMVGFCQSIFKFPAEYPRYQVALEMVEQRLTGKKLVDFNANEWEQLLLGINAALISGGGVMRTDNSVVVNSLKFHQCPSNKESFTEIDQYFVKTQPKEELNFWKGIRVKVFNFVYKSGPNDFTSEEMEFLVKHELLLSKICSRPKDLKKLMKSLCRELPKEMEKAKDVFDLMAYVHQKVLHTHYFKDGNGRVARILMGLIACQAGIQPVLIERSQDYLRAVGEENPTMLADLLRQLSESQAKSLADARNPTLEMLLKGITRSGSR